MKSKKLTYFLVVAVLAIWGLIIYRIVASINTGDDTTTAPTILMITPYQKTPAN